MGREPSVGVLTCMPSCWVSQHLEKVRLEVAKLMSSGVILLPLEHMQLDHACLCNLGLVTLTSFSRSSLETPPLSYSERTRHD